MNILTWCYAITTPHVHPSWGASTTNSMFSRTLCSTSRSLTASISTILLAPSKTHCQYLKAHLIPTTFLPAAKKIPISVPKSLFVRMASGERKFPPQKQDTQPGKEHVMDPTPQFTSPDYKPSNKLQVYTFTGFFFVRISIFFNN